MKNKILSHLPGDFPWQVHWFDTIDSTNDRAKAMAEDGAPHGTVLIAGHQTKGRGRMGRSFISSSENGLYFTLILRPKIDAEDCTLITVLAATAVAKKPERVTATLMVVRKL